jgi:hypothetical protein
MGHMPVKQEGLLFLFEGFLEVASLEKCPLSLQDSVDWALLTGDEVLLP